MSAITIPEGFFPPPGVPFETEAQRDLACALHDARFVNVEYRRDDGEWINGAFDGEEWPVNYRLATPKPRTVGPFESNNELYDYSNAAYVYAINAARDAGFDKFRIKLTATAEEIV